MGQLSGIKIATPTYKDTIPSSGKAVKLTPFRVGDEKVLLIASQSKDPKQMVDALKTVVQNCVEGVRIDDLASFDLEYLFIKLRSVSVGETAKIGLACSNCEGSNKLEVDLSSVKVKKNASHKNIVNVTKELIFEMKYPDVGDVDIKDDSIESIIDVIAHSVKNVFNGEETITIGPEDIDDLKNILNSLTSAQFADIQKFFETAPKLSHDVTFKCEHCGFENKHTLEGLASFF